MCKLFLQHIDKREIEQYKLKLKVEGEAFLKRVEQETYLKKELEIELGRWSNTLLSAANGLIGRLKYIQANTIDSTDDYYISSTRYYICQYLCWEQIYRKSKNMSILAPVGSEFLVSDLLKNVSIALRENTLSFPIIRSLEQKYIGESLISEEQCISYKKFHDEKTLENYAALNNFVDALLSNQNTDYIIYLIEKVDDLKKHFQLLLGR